MAMVKFYGLSAVFVLMVVLQSAAADIAGLPDSEFLYIKDYISAREPRHYTLANVYTDPRDPISREVIVGMRFRTGKTGAESIFQSALPGVSFDDVKNRVLSLTDPQIDDLFAADLPYYIEETRALVDSFDSYPLGMKTAFVDSHFTNYTHTNYWSRINGASENFVETSFELYTNDSVFTEATGDSKSRFRGQCELMVDYAGTLNHTVSTYDPCYEELLFPYGPEFGDNTNEPNDDGSSGEIFLSTIFPFFDHNHQSLWVNTNGVISFLTEVMSFTPDPFPLDSDRRLVAPFWADVNTQNGGNVFYREITNPYDSSMKLAGDFIRQEFVKQDLTSFKPTWLLVATWDAVPFFGATMTGEHKRNTFQCVLVTNGRHSFTIFHYGNVTWTTGSASGGDSDTGLGGTPAQVGFNAGDGVTFYAVNGSRTPDIVDVDTWTNVDVTGRFMFQIDERQISENGCNTEGAVATYPTFGYMLGGQRIYVSGPCFGTTVHCKFGENVVEGTVSGVNLAVCTTPIFYEVGRLDFSLSVDGGANYDKYRGIFTVVSEEYRTTGSIKREDSLNWHNLNSLTINWDPAEIGSPGMELNVFLYGYVEDQETDQFGLQLAGRLNFDPISNTGSFTFKRDLLGEDRYHVGVIRLVDRETHVDNHPRSLWSDIHSLKWKYNVVSLTYCENEWAPKQDASLLGDLEPCPCRLPQARVDTGRYTAHPTCNEASSGEGNCPRKPKAHHCVRANDPSVHGAGQQCCYDEIGNLILGFDENSSGTSHRRHHNGVYPYKSPGKVPYLSHYQEDLMPWEHCCVYSQGHCEDIYHMHRPSDSCTDYEPPTPGGGGGDPHPITLDGFAYTFNGHGEFHLLKTTDFSFAMQGRMEKYTLVTGEAVQDGTVFTALAMRSHDSDTIQIQVNERRALDAWINSTEGDVGWQKLDFEEKNARDVRGASLVKDNVGNSKVVITVSFDMGLSVQVTATEGSLMLSYMLFGPPSLKGKTLGLMGTWNANADDDLLTPDGVYLSPSATTRDIHYLFGLKWNVSADESLFRYELWQSHDSINDYNYEPVLEIPDSEDAPAFCDDDVQCTYDYFATGSKSFALETKQTVEQYKSFVEDTTKVVSCGFVATPGNGTKLVDKYTEGGTANFQCNEGFYIIGSEERTCCGNGTWSGVQPYCEVVDCGSPKPADNAYTYPTCTEYNCTVEYTCLSGYIMHGSQVRTCQADGTWGGSTTCKKDLRLIWIGVGVVLAVIAVVCLVVAILCCVQRHNANKAKKADDKLPRKVHPDTKVECFDNEAYDGTG